MGCPSLGKGLTREFLVQSPSQSPQCQYRIARQFPWNLVKSLQRLWFKTVRLHNPHRIRMRRNTEGNPWTSSSEP